MTAGGGPGGGGSETRPYGGVALVAGAACCFGAISTLAVFGTRAYGGRPAASLDAVLFWRYVVAGAVLGPAAWLGWRRAGGAPALGAGGWASALALGGLGQAAVAFLSLSAVRYVSVATLGFLFYTFPAWVALFAALGGTERLDRTRLAALALSLAGIACTVGLPGGAPAAGGAGAGPAWPGVALALGAAVVYAVYVPYLGRLQGRLGPTGAGAVICAGAALVLGAAGVARGTLTAALAPQAWAAVGVLAILCTVLAFVAFMRGLGRIGPVRASIVSTVEPFFTAVLGALVLGQPFGAATVAGGALIAAAVLLLQRPARGARARAAAERSPEPA